MTIVFFGSSCKQHQCNLVYACYKIKDITVCCLYTSILQNASGSVVMRDFQILVLCDGVKFSLNDGICDLWASVRTGAGRSVVICSYWGKHIQI